MSRINIVLCFILLLFLACGDSKFQNKSSKENTISEIINDSDSARIAPKETVCEDCDQIFLNFPNDPLSFEKLYGYPHGSRQFQDYDDIQALFDCLNNCYKEEILINVIKLSASIQYDVDAPTYIRSGLTKILKNDKSNFVDIYRQIDCNVFRSHIKYLFSGVENTDFIEELKVLLESIEIDDACKKKVIQNIPNMIETDH
jgi:hypothetical protein